MLCPPEEWPPPHAVTRDTQVHPAFSGSLRRALNKVPGDPDAELMCPGPVAELRTTGSTKLK